MAPGRQTPKKKHLSEIDSLRKEFTDKQLIKQPEHQKKNSLIFSVFEGFVNWSLAAQAKTPKGFVRALFNPIIEKYGPKFDALNRNIMLSGIRLLPETYIALLLATSVGMSAFTALVAATTTLALGLGMLPTIFVAFGASATVFVATAFVFYTYPEVLANQRKTSIEANLPFALNHMAAISSSGVPPENLFKLLVKLGEYGAITDESKKIAKRVDAFGEDITSALSKVAKETPSTEFKDLLYGILSVIESGGNLQDYLNDSAQAALFNYKLKRRKYLATLSTFADIYTALLIAAPLFLVAILVIINIVPGSSIGGLTIPALMVGGVYVIIPLLNIIFLALLNYTQPEV